MVVRWLFNGCSMVVQWLFNGCSMVVQILTGPDGGGIDDLKEKLSRVLKDKVRRGSLDEEQRMQLTQHGTLVLKVEVWLKCG
jgi:hypothetical protein